MVSAILVLIKDFLTTSALYNIMIQQTILLIAPIGHQFGDESLCEDLVEIRGCLRLIKKSPPAPTGGKWIYHC